MGAKKWTENRNVFVLLMCNQEIEFKIYAKKQYHVHVFFVGMMIIFLPCQSQQSWSILDIA